MRKRLAYKLFWLAAVMLTGFYQCVDPYRPKLDDEDSAQLLVVEGLISDMPGSFEVFLTRSVALDTMVNYTTEEGAQVYILDDQNKRFDLIETSPGLYKSEDVNAKTEIGRSYQLFITDVFGVNYESTPVLVEPSPEIEEVAWEEIDVEKFVDNEIIREKAISIFVNSHDPSGETEYYQWDIEETWEVEMPSRIMALDGFGMPYETSTHVPLEKKRCWVTKSSKNILIESTANHSSSVVDKFVVKKIGQDEDLLFYRYSILVKQYRINSELYQFWKKLKEVNEGAGSLYDQVPTATFGNVSCCDGSGKVLGYFNAVDVKSKRIFIEKGEHVLPTENYYEGCVYVTDRTPYHFAERFYARSKFCSDCTNYGSNVKPDFW
jgi:hypothetical protein